MLLGDFYIHDKVAFAYYDRNVLMYRFIRKTTKENWQAFSSHGVYIGVYESMYLKRTLSSCNEVRDVKLDVFSELKHRLINE